MNVYEIEPVIHDTMIFESNLNSCPCCNTSLRTYYHTRLKSVITLEKEIKAKQIVKICPNKLCRLNEGDAKGIFKSQEFQLLALPDCTYGIDITIYIGYYMSIKHQSLNEVHKDLKGKEINLSINTVYKQHQKYLLFTKELTDESIELLKENMINNGGYILSVDAVQYKDSPLLFVCRDLISGMVLIAKLIDTENKVEISNILRYVKENFGNPIAIVSDMSPGIKKAVKNVFPKIKHQYCQFHFLKNLGKDLLKGYYGEASQIIGENKKNINKLVKDCQNTLETLKLETANNDEKIDEMTSCIIEEGLKVIKSQIKSKKGFPFDLPHIMLLEKLYASQNFLKQAIIRLTMHYVNNPLTINLQNLLSYIENIFSRDTTSLIRKIKVLYSKYLRLREILSQDGKSTKQIKNLIRLFMKQLKKQSSRYPRFKIIINRLKKYWNYLFHGYDDDRIPLTNLEIERSFNSFKRSFRK